MLAALRAILNRGVSVGALLETAVWLALPYVLIGLVLTVTHPANVNHIQQQLQARVPQSAEFELVAFGVATALWPALLVPPVSCPPSPPAVSPRTDAPTPSAA